MSDGPGAVLQAREFGNEARAPDNAQQQHATPKESNGEIDEQARSATAAFCAARLTAGMWLRTHPNASDHEKR
jgi:hypothetical protein